MSLYKFAESELQRAGFMDDESDYGGLLAESALEVIDLISEQEHSGASVSMLMSIVDRLVRFEPLSPLTGEDDEWNEVTDDLFQNKRSPSVFKGRSGAYDIDGIVFEDPDGSRYTNSASRTPVTFPYYPVQKIVKRDFSGALLDESPQVNACYALGLETATEAA